MGITRIYTDISAARVRKILQEIEFDGGRAQQAPQSDGRVTIIAEFPDIRPAVLLGGNQSDAVGFASFNPAAVLARRLP
ncbi:MAG: hypothetical protein ACREV1_08795 [Gammaproteobacteria bacterium]